MNDNTEEIDNKEELVDYPYIGKGIKPFKYKKYVSEEILEKII